MSRHSTIREGLTYANGVLYESTGLYGESKVRQLDPQTGTVLLSKDLDSMYFGEGMAYVKGTMENNPMGNGNDILVQITWQEKVGFVYDADTLNRLYKFDFDTFTSEGWGITYIPETQQLVVSDGSDWLHVWDVNRVNESSDGVYYFTELKRIQVHRSTGITVNYINELEYVSGWILANIWYEDVIIRINPETGLIEEEYDFQDLWPLGQRVNADCFNGISIVGEGNATASNGGVELYVTGKNWPTVYRVKILGLQPNVIVVDSRKDITAAASEAASLQDTMNNDSAKEDEAVESVECVSGGRCFEVLGTIPHDPTSFT